ncbi:MAG TPA: hypothetical protein PLN94_13575 [Thiolinea sp.]|nr:hypothetical protein [Thiolinea sp.]
MTASKKSQVQINHRDRLVNAYPILEYELDLLIRGQASSSFHTTLSAVSFTIFLAVLVPLLLTEPAGLNPMAEPYFRSVCCFALILAIASGIKALHEKKESRRMVESIKSQMRQDATSTNWP